MDIGVVFGKKAVDGAGALALVRNAFIHLGSLEDAPAQKGFEGYGPWR